MPWCDSPELCPKHANGLDSVSSIWRELLRDEPPDQSRESWSLAVRANHDLQGSIAVHATKEEVALRGYVCNVSRDTALLAELPDGRGRGWVIDRHEYHVCIVKI